ncbi:hypothetical protein PENTCL1PPCAC_10366, partial [Pristionchus entomophagus]
RRMTMIWRVRRGGRLGLGYIHWQLRSHLSDELDELIDAKKLICCLMSSFLRLRSSSSWLPPMGRWAESRGGVAVRAVGVVREGERCDFADRSAPPGNCAAAAATGMGALFESFSHLSSSSLSTCVADGSTVSPLSFPDPALIVGSVGGLVAILTLHFAHSLVS